jgi:hypothetical protein
MQGFGLRFGERKSEAEAERRRERSRSGTTVAVPQAEARRSFGIRNAARDEGAFLQNGTDAYVRGFGRTAAGEGRVRERHCCRSLPSEPDVRLSPHPAQAVLKLCVSRAGVHDGLIPASAR